MFRDLQEATTFREPERADPNPMNNAERRNLRLEAAQWIHEHPMAALMFLRFARELAGRGRRFGVGLLAERVRWEVALEGLDESKYKVNNDHRAYIARWLIDQDPSLEQWMRFRKVRW